MEAPFINRRIRPGKRFLSFSSQLNSKLATSSGSRIAQVRDSAGSLVYKQFAANVPIFLGMYYDDTTGKWHDNVGGRPCTPFKHTQGAHIPYPLTAFSEGYSYSKGDEVYYDGKWYISSEDALGVIPGTEGSSFVEYGYYFENGGRLLCEPAATNKCTCNNHNPTDTTNVTKYGNTSATLTVVDDADELAAVGLDNICSSGKVYKLDNTVGSGLAYAQVTGACGNTNKHTASAFIRTTGSTATIAIGGYGASYVSATHYTRIEVAKTTPVTSDTLQLYAQFGTVLYFILVQLEEGPIASSLILTTTAAASRTAAITTIPVEHVIPKKGCDFTMILTGEITWKSTEVLYLFDWLDTSPYSEAFRIRTYSTGAFRVVDTRSGSTVYINTDVVLTASVPLKFKLVVRKKANGNVSVVCNNSTLINDTNGVSPCKIVPGVSSYIGSQNTGVSQPWYPRIRIMTINQAVSDDDCIALAAGTKTPQEVIDGLRP